MFGKTWIRFATAALAALPLLGWSGGEGGISRSRLVLLATVLGVAYTIYSEWLNVSVRRSWAYSSLMPTVPFIGTGLSPPSAMARRADVGTADCDGSSTLDPEVSSAWRGSDPSRVAGASH